MRTAVVEWATHCGVVLAMIPEAAALPANMLGERHGVALHGG